MAAMAYGVNLYWVYMVERSISSTSSYGGRYNVNLHNQVCDVYKRIRQSSLLCIMTGVVDVSDNRLAPEPSL